MYNSRHRLLKGSGCLRDRQKSGNQFYILNMKKSMEEKCLIFTFLGLIFLCANAVFSIAVTSMRSSPGLILFVVTITKKSFEK